ncbi:hypothetical protein [Desmospora activa]|nr:hypothetical protein [Desmospora activa]
MRGGKRFPYPLEYTPRLPVEAIRIWKPWLHDGSNNPRGEPAIPRGVGAG